MRGGKSLAERGMIPRLLSGSESTQGVLLQKKMKY